MCGDRNELPNQLIPPSQMCFIVILHGGRFVTLEDAEATIKTGIVPENRRAPIAAPAAEPAAADVKAPVAAEARAPAHAASASAAAAAAAADAAANSRAAAKPKENGAAPAAAKVLPPFLPLFHAGTPGMPASWGCWQRL